MSRVRQARPKEKEYKLSDQRGLLLVVRPTGAKWWRLRYQFQGKEKMISLGVYPDVSLSMARDRRDAARRLVADGKDPSAERQAEKQALEAAGKCTFELIARHYLAQLARKVRKAKASIKTYKKAKWMLETFIFPALGNRPIPSITAPQLLVELKKIEMKGLNKNRPLLCDRQTAHAAMTLTTRAERARCREIRRPIVTSTDSAGLRDVGTHCLPAPLP